MKIVDPSAEIIHEANPLKRIELCGRVCYKSEDRITADSAYQFCKNLVNRGHTSVLEHARVIIPAKTAARYNDKPLTYGGKDRVVYTHTISGSPLYMTMNACDFISIDGTIDELATLKNAADYMTVRFICDRGISHELVRHRVMSFSQESTRYVNYKDGVQFVNPIPYELDEDDIESCESSEKLYIRKITKGQDPQRCRGVLNTHLKTELAMTGTFEHWRGIFRLRLHKKAHPQMQYLMGLLRDKLVNTEFSQALPPDLQ